MGAGSPANTGIAGAIHRVAFFAGKPAPTGASLSQWIATRQRGLRSAACWGLKVSIASRVNKAVNPRHTASASRFSRS